MIARLSIFLALCGTILAADSGLDAFRATLLPMRADHSAQGKDARGATPQLTVAKHQLRDWLDMRLATLHQRTDAAEVQRALNADLRDAGLVCDDDAGPIKCPDWTLLGFADTLTVKADVGFLVITAGVGIECGYDESAYIYSWNGEKWTRVWQNEQNTYEKDKYWPQTLDSVLISPYNRANDYLVMTLGSESWCASNWHHVYYRVFRLGPDQQAEPLVSGGEWTAVGWRDPPILGSIASDDVLVEYYSKSIDSGRLVREGVFHYQIQHGDAKRIDPFALSPRDFVDEWLGSEWPETMDLTEGANRSSIMEWRKRFDTEGISGEFQDPTLHCRTSSDLWQVGLDFRTELNGTPTAAYFLIRWRPPYRFRLVAVSDTPSPGCSEKDPQADAQRTLFPVQDWR